LVVEEGGELAFLHPLPVSELWGVGRATRVALERLGIATVGQLSETPKATLERALGSAVGGHLWDLAQADDPRPVDPAGQRKSVSAERTFGQDLTDPAAIDQELLRLCDEVSARLRASGVSGRTISLKVRKADFSTLTRSRTLPEATDVSAVIVDAARELFASLRWRSPRARLLGVGASSLVEGHAPSQLRLEGPDWQAIDSATDAVRSRFGAGSLIRARLQRSDEKFV
jgi:DNA polymerase-4